MSEVRQIDMPADARELVTLPRVDYQDAFLLETEAAEERTAEDWARAALEGAPAATRAALTSGWFSLGLKLGPPTRSDDRILGWRIAKSTPGHVLLSAGSRVGMPAQLLCKRDPGRVFFGTFITHENVATRALWVGVEPVHVRVVASILADRNERDGALACIATPQSSQALRRGGEYRPRKRLGRYAESSTHRNRERDPPRDDARQSQADDLRRRP